MHKTNSHCQAVTVHRLIGVNRIVRRNVVSLYRELLAAVAAAAVAAEAKCGQMRPRGSKSGGGE